MDPKNNPHPLIIIYVKNQWGKCMPIEFAECCQAMTISYNPEQSVFQGYELDNTTGKFIFVEQGGKRITEMDKCPFCDSEIITEERPLSNYTENDPPCMYSGCGRPSTFGTEITVRGFKIKVSNCDLHDSEAMRLTERLHVF